MNDEKLVRSKRMSGLKAITVVAQKNGIGKVKPFGTYTSRQYGAMVRIDGRDYKVDKNGYVNIPKRIMGKFGNMGDDERNRIDIKFATKRTPNGDHTQKVHTQLFKTLDENRNNPHGSTPYKIQRLESDMFEIPNPDDCLDGEDDEYSK